MSGTVSGIQGTETVLTTFLTANSPEHGCLRNTGGFSLQLAALLLGVLLDLLVFLVVLLTVVSLTHNFLLFAEFVEPL